MDLLDIKNNYIDVYSRNSDWAGRTVKDSCEVVDYQDDSTIRIWYNEQNISYEPHWHTAMEIIMPVDNHYDVIVNGYTYHILPGEIFIIPPGETHELIAPESGVRFIFLFDISSITQLKGFSGIQPMLNQPIHVTKTIYNQIYDDVYRLLIQMRNEYFGDHEFRELTIYAHIIEMFVLFGRNKLSSVDLFPNVRSYKQKEYLQRFNEVLDYIDLHYTEELSLDEVADFSGFSKYHFTRLFKQYTDSTFYDYLSFKRIKAAELLLTKPEMSITEIALQSGFSSISTFNRIFKQRKNCTPSQYRALYTKNSC